MPTAKKESDYIVTGTEMGFFYIGPFPANTKQITYWECPVGHIIDARYNDIQQGLGCKYCNGRYKKIAEDYLQLANDRGYIWSEILPVNTNEKTKWICPLGHIWIASYTQLRVGGCWECGQLRTHEKLKIPPKSYHQIAESRGFRWIGPEVGNIGEDTFWECAEGHIWQACYRNIKYGETGCPDCAPNSRVTLHDYQKLADRIGLKLVGPIPKNSGEETEWICLEKNHNLLRSYQSLIYRKGCPACSDLTPKTEEDYLILAKRVGYTYLGPFPENTKSPTNWECEKGHIFSNIYNTVDQLNGGCRECARNKPITEYDCRDLAELKKLKWHGPSCNANENTYWECLTCAYSFARTYSSLKFRDNAGCPKCAGKVAITKEEYLSVADQKNLRLLSDIPPTTLDKATFECLTCGYSPWHVRYADLKHHDVDCPKCNKIINGKMVSKVQERLVDMLGADINHLVPCETKAICVDAAIIEGSNSIAVEYDSWYYHGGRTEKDELRNSRILKAGWRLLVIKSNRMLPNEVQLELALDQLRNKASFIEIVLDDWGIGNTLKERG